MKVGDLVRITSKETDWDYGRLVLLLESRGIQSYNLGKDVGELFTGMTMKGITEYYVFEKDAEVVSESR